MTQSPRWYIRLLTNNRFWILALAVTLSINVAGFVQLQIPDGTLQVIRIEQAFGFISLFCLYVAIIISPLTKVLPNLPAKAAIVHARRAIGVSAFYYAALHVYLTFFLQLGGFEGIAYLDTVYWWSLVLGLFAFGVLIILAVTSFDYVVAKMSYKYWKRMHRVIYAGSIAVLVHVLLIGSHFSDGLTVIGAVTIVAVGFLVVIEILRIRVAFIQRRRVE